MWSFQGTLYLPRGLQGRNPPARRHLGLSPGIRHARPRPVRSADRSDRFTFYRGTSQLFFVTQGYAVLDNADDARRRRQRDGQRHLRRRRSWPTPRRPSTSSTRWASADPKRVGVGGHSYGAFMTANLLAHCDLFARRHRPQRRLQPHPDAVRLPERAADALGGARAPTSRCRRSCTPTRSKTPLLHDPRRWPTTIRAPSRSSPSGSSPP
ncbi:MAG: hypothetical protein MZU84_09145 [Sphingobacterium sp.]|nr:hypothetical protein [Sphingobacterium sp.]